MSTQSKTLSAGRLRHRIGLERELHTQNPITGAMTTTWTTVVENLPAHVEPLSGRDFIAAAQLKSQISARITIRYRAGINAAMRAIHNGTTYKIVATLPDPNSGREWLTLLVKSA